MFFALVIRIEHVGKRAADAQLGRVFGVVSSLLIRFSLTDLFVPLLVLVLLTGFVASARLKLNAHTTAQIGAGLVLGLSVSVLTVFWLV